MTLTALVGDLGAGKTLFLTNQAIEDDRPVYSNYEIKIDRYHALTPEMLVDIEGPALIIIDDAYDWLESRLSGRDINRYFSYVYFQSRKRGLEFMISIQLLSTIDLRYRDMITYLVLAEKIEDVGFQYTIVKNTMRQQKAKVLFLPYENAEELFPMYNSWEYMPTIDAELMSKVIEATNPEGLNIEVANMAREIITKNPNKKITKGFVKDYLIQNKKPLNHTEHVYNRIQTILSSIGDKCNAKE
jgi:hypothetical protein